MSEKRQFNFRSRKERLEFLEQVKQDIRKAREELGEETASALRVVFQIGDYTTRERKSAQAGESIQGIRNFRDLRRLRRFVESENEGGSGPAWRGKRIHAYPITAMLAYYEMRGGRIVGEKIIQTYEIE
jgi:hypothetical protein